MRLRELVCKTAYCTCGPVIEVAPNANPDPDPDLCDLVCLMEIKRHSTVRYGLLDYIKLLLVLC